MSKDERRISPRVAMDVEVGMESDSNFYTGLTQDISSGGIFVATHQLRPVGERIQIRFTLPGHPRPTTIATEAEVRWIRDPPRPDPDMPTGMGLRFLRLSREEQAAILNFIKARESLFYDDE